MELESSQFIRYAFSPVLAFYSILACSFTLSAHFFFKQMKKTTCK